MSAVVHVAVSLGTNLGDRRAHLRFAVRRLAVALGAARVSTFRETNAVGVGSQPRYLNGAVVGVTAVPPEILLEQLRSIERQRARRRPWPGAPRTLDLDLILYGTAIIERADLTLPHPRFRQRAFVLQPLAEIAPCMVDPVTGKTVGQLWNEWGRSDRERVAY